MLPNTPDRVPLHTSAAVNRRIQQDISGRVRWHTRHPERIDQRLRELDAEWDIERTLDANAATLALTGTLLGIFVDRRFLALPVAVTPSCFSTPFRAGVLPSHSSASAGFAPLGRSMRSGSRSRRCGATSARLVRVLTIGTTAPVMPSRPLGYEPQG
jgi:hypothetical protein